MTELSMVSKELAEKLLEEVDFEERLIGTTMSGSVGDQRRSLYSLKELKNLLKPVAFEDLMQRGHSQIAYANLDELLPWIRDVHGDKELADAISASMSEVKSIVEKLEVSRKLIVERLNQCEEALLVNS